MSDLHSFTVDLSRPHSVPWLEFELPTPPSVNRFMGKLGNRTPIVAKWIRQADISIVRTGIKRPAIKGKFEAEFRFSRNNRTDFHNLEKVLFDWLQSRELIENDKLCEWRASGWGDHVPKGRVMVKLRPWMRP